MFLSMRSRWGEIPSVDTSRSYCKSPSEWKTMFPRTKNSWSMRKELYKKFLKMFLPLGLNKIMGKTWIISQGFGCVFN